MKTLFYYDEIAAIPKTIPKMKLDENELNMAKMLIEQKNIRMNIRLALEKQL